MKRRRDRETKRRSGGGGFTLIEVMISLFIVLLLLIGINLVFTTTAATITQGNTLNDITSNARAAQDVLSQDMENCVRDGPVFVISSEAVATYQSLPDAQAANFNYVPAAIIGARSTAVPQARISRTDEISFFVRNLAPRQTGGTGGASPTQAFSSQVVGSEAYIHYGHGKTPTPSLTNYYGPDDLSINPFSTPANVPDVTLTVAPYAADWIVARTRIAMRIPDLGSPASYQGYPVTPAGSINEPGTTNANLCYTYTSPAQYQSPWGSLNVLAPLGCHTYDSSVTATPSNALPGNEITSSRYDLANVSIDQFRSIITDAVRSDATSSNSNMDIWWDPMVYTQPHAGSAGSRTARFWDPNGNLRYRFRVSPGILARPLNPRATAEMAPFFLQHVSQFIVEYAGDFVSQDTNLTVTVAGVAQYNPNYGNPTNLTPDADIDWVLDTRGDWDSTVAYNAGDWVIDNSGSPPYYQATKQISPGASRPNGNSSWQQATATGSPVVMPPRRIRWYGYPRNLSGATTTSGSSLINVTPGPAWHGPSAGSTNFNELCDVIPLRDAWILYYINNPPASGVYTFNPYEVEEPLGDGLPRGSTTSSVGGMDNYGDPTKFSPLTSLTSSTGAYGRYVALWRNDVPAMIRILIKVDDPNNAQSTGPWFEYVFKLK